MAYLVIFLVASITLLRDIMCINTKGSKPETPLFIPSISYPALVHLHPSGYNTELLENAAAFPRYAYNHDSLEYTEPLQRQILFQNPDKRLEAIFQNKDTEKQPKETEIREENYDQLANSILLQAEQKPEFHDLDRRYKRNVISAARAPTNHKESENPYPFGAYRPTTWTPYENRQESKPPSASQVRLGSANKKPSHRRERKIPQTVEDESNFEPNNIRTARPLETLEFSKEFPDLSFFIPIQTRPLTLSNAKSESASSAYSDQLLALMRTAFDSKKVEME